MSMQLKIGEAWEIAGEPHFLDQVMGNGFLLFRSERTSAPYQIPLTSGEHVTPTVDWLRTQFASGLVRRLDHRSDASRAQKTAAGREDDFDAILARDPRALMRQVVLSALDRMHDLLLDAVEDARGRWAAAGISLGSPTPSDETIPSRMKAYDASMETLHALGLALGRWGRVEQPVRAAQVHACALSWRGGGRRCHSQGHGP